MFLICDCSLLTWNEYKLRLFGSFVSDPSFGVASSARQFGLTKCQVNILVQFLCIEYVALLIMAQSNFSFCDICMCPILA